VSARPRLIRTAAYIVATILVIYALMLLSDGPPPAPDEPQGPSPGWGPVVRIQTTWAITFPDKAACEAGLALTGHTVYAPTPEQRAAAVPLFKKAGLDHQKFEAEQAAKPIWHCEQVGVPVPMPANDRLGIRRP
jgi:hypothetical protein